MGSAEINSCENFMIVLHIWQEKNNAIRRVDRSESSELITLFPAFNVSNISNILFSRLCS